MTQQAALETITPYLVLGQTDHSGRPVIETARALHDLIVTFPPQGHYSVRTIEDECGPAVHCAFENKVDADRLAAMVGAIEIARYESHRSERAFFLSRSITQKIRSALASRPARGDQDPTGGGRSTARSSNQG
jgi:hypothetical protein